MDIETLDQLFVDCGLPGGPLEFLERPFIFSYGEETKSKTIAGKIEWISVSEEEKQILFYINAKKIEGHPIDYLAYSSDNGFAVFTSEDKPGVYYGIAMFFLNSYEENEDNSIEC